MNRNRAELLQQKAQAIEQELSEWANEQNILLLGERIHIHIEIERTPSVTSIVILPETDLAQMHVRELSLGGRVENLLNDANITNVGQLCQKTIAEMLKYQGVGRKSLREIIWKLNERGLTLAGNVPTDFLTTSPDKREKTRSQKEWEKVEIRQIKDGDWKKMLGCLRFHPYMKETIVMLKESDNKALFAAQILRNARKLYPGETEETESPGTSMTSLYRINQQFKLHGLPYRLKPVRVPRHPYHVSERKLQIGFLKEGK